MTKLGYLGPEGTYSHTMALRYAAEHECQPVCCYSLSSVFQQVDDGFLDMGIVPVENSTEGSVGETLDLLLSCEGIYVNAELLLPVRHHLLARPGTVLAGIEKVYSHPQALAQCRKFIAEHLPGAQLVETASTAAAALAVASAPLNAAAIGSDNAAATYALELLSSDIQSNNDNVTRFLVISRDNPVPAVPAKTSLALAVLDHPGALSRILREFSLRAINLTRIESRPAGSKLGDYIFFIDLVGRVDDPVVAEAVEALSNNTLWIKFLGCYPACEGMKSYQQYQGSGYSNIQQLRGKIDLVDDEILYLLTMRQRLVDRVADLKKDTCEVIDQTREAEIMNRVKEQARENNLNTDMVVKIFRLMLLESVRRQKTLISASL
ncbi:prephenate dehydratase [Desulfotomaculum arcticum]|uniref:Prephenate dehydratase n=1 Tax=Desulfotruncus arcticus DSM 17038 TaxID=1121424 RepID=A0A1I2QD24_9FIRM|nr:prephenate dehydratase [Desulfotruncus arcticus]SFG25543.1 prephenate dehydratase [Desulfotomaculum arcticum] [Desulfotruncus arcticus DSM 17038]